MAVKTFAAIDVGSYELSMKIFEISPKSGIRESCPSLLCRPSLSAFSSFPGFSYSLPRPLSPAKRS